MDQIVAARVPKEVARDIDLVSRETNLEKSKVLRELLLQGIKEKLVSIALKKYAAHEVSLGRAAELARMALADFMLVAKERMIPLHYPLASLEQDFTAALKVK